VLTDEFNAIVLHHFLGLDSPDEQEACEHVRAWSTCSAGWTHLRSGARYTARASLLFVGGSSVASAAS
jgi:hypothetical protein